MHMCGISSPSILSDFPRAADALERSIACARAAREAPELGAEFCLFTDLDFMLVTALWLYATLLIERGKFARAEPLAIESLKLFRARENQYEIADGLGTFGLLALLQGDLTRAHTLLQEAVTLASAVNGREMLGTWQPLLSLVTLYGGDALEARRLLSESLPLCLEMKDKSLLARVCAYLAEVDLWEETAGPGRALAGTKPDLSNRSGPDHLLRSRAALRRRPPGDCAAALSTRGHTLWAGRPDAQRDSQCDCRADAGASRRGACDRTGST